MGSKPAINRFSGSKNFEFDEGPLPADWIGELERRGIAVLRDLHRDAACAVLRAYGELGGVRY